MVDPVIRELDVPSKKMRQMDKHDAVDATCMTNGVADDLFEQANQKIADTTCMTREGTDDLTEQANPKIAATTCSTKEGTPDLAKPANTFAKDMSDEALSVDLKTPLSRGVTSPIFSLLTCPSWRALLEPEFKEMYFHDLTKFLAKEKRIYPEQTNWFEALNACPFEKVRVVILGQDPYHDDGQAMGLSFSIPSSISRLPSSLLNIFKEIASDLNVDRPSCGDLSSWAQQGVLLLNAVLTVSPHEANSHADKGWERFTDNIVKKLNASDNKIVFLLWGKFAEKKAQKLDAKKHCILRSPHPSGLSANRGFIGNKHFSKTNDFLSLNGYDPIQWA